MTRRILVTGASGLIGRHVVAEFQRRGADVHGCGRGEPVTGIPWYRLDLLDRDKVKSLVARVRPAIVIHCAWFTAHGRFWMAPENVEWAAGSVELAREAFDRGATRFVGVGTGAEYASDAAMPLNELDSCIAPETLYASAKDTTRRALEVLASTNGRAFAWGRVFMLYGAGEHPARLVSSLSRALVRAEPAKMSSGRAVRDFLDARDVGAAIAALALSSVEGCVNIASGEAVSIRSLAEMLAQLSGRPDLLSIGALPDRPTEPAASFASIHRLSNEVGFTPAISLARGLSDALSYWRQREGIAR